MKETKKKRPLLWAIAAFVVIIALVGMLSSGSEDDSANSGEPTQADSAEGSSSDAPFAAEDIVGMETSEAAAIFEDAGYEVKVFSQTGAELSSSGMTASNSMKWYVHECNADHAAKTVEVVVISESSDLFEGEGAEPTEGEELTQGQENAVKTASNYLSFSSFSKSGLKEQLEFEGFTEEEAEYAVNAVSADWKEQAVDKAEEYLGFMCFSKSGLKEQLEFEGFTSDEAEHAVNSVSVDWNEQAAGKAEEYMDFSSFSKQGLIDQLVFEGFTQEQAEYGAEAAGY